MKKCLIKITLEVGFTFLNGLLVWGFIAFINELHIEDVIQVSIGWKEAILFVAVLNMSRVVTPPFREKNIPKEIGK